MQTECSVPPTRGAARDARRSHQTRGAAGRCRSDSYQGLYVRRQSWDLLQDRQLLAAQNSFIIHRKWSLLPGTDVLLLLHWLTSEIWTWLTKRWNSAKKWLSIYSLFCRRKENMFMIRKFTFIVRRFLKYTSTILLNYYSPQSTIMI